MNLDALVTDTYNRMGMGPNDGHVTPAVVKQLVNDANHYIATVHDWPWQQKKITFSTVAGQADYAASTYAPAGDWLRTSDLRITGPARAGSSMTWYSPMELDDRWNSGLNARQGAPCDYAVDADKIRLGPTPNGIYTIGHRYVILEADLANGTDVPLMPVQFQPAITEYAAFLGLRRSDEETRAQVCLGAFNGWIAILHQDRKRSTAPQRIRVRPGYRGP